MSQHQHLEPQEPSPPPAMAGRSLLDLPNEVLHEVCALLCLHCQEFLDVSCDGAFEGTTQKHKRARLHATAPSKLRRPLHNVTEKHERIRLHVAALANLCRTSRRLNTLATPFLYHAFFSMTHQRPFFNFMRTLVQYPVLGTSVRQATFNIFRVGVDDMASINRLVEHLGVWLPKGWKTPQPVRRPVHHRSVDFGDGSFQEGFRHGFLVDMFLSSAVNLQQLSLQLSRTTVYGKFMLPSSSLQSLKSLHLAHRVTHRGETTGFNLEAVAGVLKKAPNLEYLEAYMCYSCPRRLNLSNLKVLTLPMCTLSSGMLRDLASSCKQLKAFTFEYIQPQGPDERLYYRPRVVPPGAISRGLEHCSKTLEYLEIQVGNWEGIKELEHHDMITSLKSFTALRTLVIDQTCFLGGDVEQEMGRPLFHTLLPASIAKVILKGADLYCLFPDLAELVKETENGLFPDLKRLDIYCQAIGQQHMPVSLDMAFRDAGVLLAAYIPENGKWVDVVKIGWL